MISSEALPDVPITIESREIPNWVCDETTSISNFVQCPIPQGKMAFCHIERCPGVSGKYNFFVENHSLRKRYLVLSCRKQFLRANVCYKVFVPSNSEEILVGKLKGNIFGTLFSGFSTSKENKDISEDLAMNSCSDLENPESISSSCLQSISSSNFTSTSNTYHLSLVFPAIDGPYSSSVISSSAMISPPSSSIHHRKQSPYRLTRSKESFKKSFHECCEIIAVKFKQNFFGVKGPRKITTIIPGMISDDTRISTSHLNGKSSSRSLFDLQKESDKKVIVTLENKSPQWNDTINSYTLDFRSRVTLASVKNFQIVHPLDVNYIVVQMGKCGPDLFTVDVQYPMSLLQAFFLAISSFHSKMACD